MPFSRPTLTDLKTQIAQDIATDVPGGDALARFSALGVLGKAQARLASLHYGYLDWISKQAVPFSATDEFLEGWAGLVGITRKAATAAIASATFSGTIGSVIPAGTLVVRGDTTEYTTDADATADGAGSVVVAITASLAGAAGNADAGTPVTLGSAVAGVQSGGTLTTAATGGADVEINDDLRSRMLERYQAPPQGGAAGDYIAWALEVAGVTRAWEVPRGMGAGTVVVYVMLDLAQAVHDGFPQGSDGVAAAETRASAATGDQLAVADHIFPLQPVTALVYVSAPTAAPQNFTVSGLSGASTATKAAISAAISGVLLRQGTAASGTVDLSDINAAIIGVAGTAGYVLTAPTVNITTSVGSLPTLGTITYA